MAMTGMAATVPHQDSTHLLADPPALSAKARADGYFFFEGLLPPAEVLSLRRQILETAQRHGFLDEQAPLIDGVARSDFYIGESSNNPHWKAYYCDILKLRDLHALALQPQLQAVFTTLFGEPVLPHSRNISMALFPRDVRQTTPVHQDFEFIGGTEETWTSWIPCGDCPLDLGGLAIVPGSHKQGFQPHPKYDPNSTGLAVPSDTEWAVGDLQCGDVLVFRSTTMHQGIDNISEDRIRLSLDFRYQPLSHPVRRDSMEPHRQWLSWGEVYRQWPDGDPIRYYWRDWNLKMVERDGSDAH